MMRFKTCLSASLLALVFSAAPEPSWSTRMPGKMVTGVVTSMPAPGLIEIDHLTYHVKIGSAAERNLHNFHMGQVVDVELDGPATTKSTVVVFIATHAGTRAASD